MEAIFVGDVDREAMLALLGQVCARFNWICHAYCLMTNHYHLVVETPDGNLSRGMRHFNGVYTQRFNRRHDRVGHVFQGRYHAVLVDKDAYLMELARYVVLNPVRARMVQHPGQWQWSSYRATVDRVAGPWWMETDWLLSQFGSSRVWARSAYKCFVHQGKGVPSIWSQLRSQVYLGDESFIEETQRRVHRDADLTEVPRAQARPPGKPIAHYTDAHTEPRVAMARAYLSGHHTMKEIARHFGVHYTTVSRAVMSVSAAPRTR